MIKINVKEVGDWKLAKVAINRLNKDLTDSEFSSSKKIGEYLVNEIKSGIINQAPGGKPFKNKLSPVTSKLKGGNKQILLDNYDLINAITYRIDRTASKLKELFVGVTPNSPQILKAKVHEYGLIISKHSSVVKIKRWIFAQLQKFYKDEMNLIYKTLGPGKKYIPIPARPFIKPTIDAVKANIPVIFRQNFYSEMKRKFEK